MNLLENDSQFSLSETSDIEVKLQYHLKLITSSTDNIILIITNLVKFIDNFEIDGNTKKNIVIFIINKFLSDNTQKDYIINIICPSLIDILISVDKRKIILRKKPSCFVT